MPGSRSLLGHAAPGSPVPRVVVAGRRGPSPGTRRARREKAPRHEPKRSRPDAATMSRHPRRPPRWPHDAGHERAAVPETRPIPPAPPRRNGCEARRAPRPGSGLGGSREGGWQASSCPSPVLPPTRGGDHPRQRSRAPGAPPPDRVPRGDRARSSAGADAAALAGSAHGPWPRKAATTWATVDAARTRSPATNARLSRRGHGHDDVIARQSKPPRKRCPERGAPNRRGPIHPRTRRRRRIEPAVLRRLPAIRWRWGGRARHPSSAPQTAPG